MNLKPLAIAAAGVAITMLNPAPALSDNGSTYRVTITNLSAGQPLTPPILATHRWRTGFFTVGEYASEEIRAIAENGNGSLLLEALDNDPLVHQVVMGSEPLVPANDPGNTGFSSTASYEITAYGSAKFISFASMLICTNDGFTGLDTISLPKRKKTIFTVAYDARTETNTEDLGDIVPPCQGLIGVTSDAPGTGESNPRLAEDGIVIPHVGINGGVDLYPQVHGWSDPVTKIVIERIKY